MAFPAPVDWAAERLRGMGIAVTGPAEPLETRAWSRQFRVPTTAGRVYLKCSPPVFGHEAALTRALSGWFPGAVPEVLAIDAGRNWMLTADFGPDLRSAPPERIRDACAEMVPALAGIQVNAARHVGALLETGCPDHRLAVLPDLFDELVAGPGDPALLVGRPGGLTPGEHRRLRGLAGDVREICERLASYSIPETVVHADIWRGNFVVTEAGALIFDWAESVVGHPFCSLEVVLRDVQALAPGDEAFRSRIEDAYLSAWTARESPARLEEAVRLAAVPTVVSRAVMWRDVLNGLDDTVRPSYEGVVADVLRPLLRAGALAPAR